jgi:calmodulin
MPQRQKPGSVGVPDASHHERREVQAHFVHADADNDRHINFTEFCRVLEDLEAGTSREEARIGFGEIDVDGNGLIDFDEFFAWWQES